MNGRYRCGARSWCARGAAARMPENAIRTVWFVWWISWMAAAAWSDRAVKRPPRRHQIVYRLFAAVGAVLLFGLYRHDVRAEVILWLTPRWLAASMVVMAAAGLLFTWWARLHLGRLWSAEDDLSNTRVCDRCKRECTARTGCRSSGRQAGGRVRWCKRCGWGLR